MYSIARTRRRSTPSDIQQVSNSKLRTGVFILAIPPSDAPHLSYSKVTTGVLILAMAYNAGVGWRFGTSLGAKLLSD